MILKFMIIKRLKYTNFLINGDFVTFNDENDFSKYPSITIYTLSEDENKWERKPESFYKFNEKDITFGGVINDKMWIKVDYLIFLLDLSDFKLQKILFFVSFFFLLL